LNGCAEIVSQQQPQRGYQNQQLQASSSFFYKYLLIRFIILVKKLWVTEAIKIRNQAAIHFITFAVIDPIAWMGRFFTKRMHGDIMDTTCMTKSSQSPLKGVSKTYQRHGKSVRNA